MTTEDWRLQASTTLATDVAAAYPGGPSFPAGSRVVLSSTAETGDGIASFYTPSAVALALSIAAKACGVAQQLRAQFSTVPAPSPEGPVQSHRNHSALFDYFEQCFVACMFAYQAVEAYCNFKIAYNLRGDVNIARRKGAEVMDRERIERLPVAEKLDLVLPSLTGTDTPKGTIAWEHFRALEALRDSTVHLKSHHQWTASKAFTDSPYAAFLNTSPNVCVEYSVEVIGCFANSHERGWLTSTLASLAGEARSPAA
jgi:hypothetical protein